MLRAVEVRGKNSGEAEPGLEEAIGVFERWVEVMESAGLIPRKDRAEADLECARLSPRHDRGVEVFRAAVTQLGFDLRIAARIEYRHGKGQAYATLVVEEFPFERMKGGRIGLEYSRSGGWKLHIEIRNPVCAGLLETMQELSPEAMRIGEEESRHRVAERLAAWAASLQRVS